MTEGNIMFSQYPDVLRVEDVIEILNIGKNSMYKLLREKKIKSFRIGNVHKIPKQSLIEYIQSEVSLGI